MMNKYFRKANAIFNQNVRSKIDPRFKINHKGKGRINFIDVGSIGGLPEPWNAHAHLVKYLLNFEPNDTPQQGPNHMTYNTAVWETDETLPFYIYKGFKGTGSSLFEQNFEYVKANFETLKKNGPLKLAQSWFDRSQLVRTTELKCRKLDSILGEQFPDKQFHFIKIDAQGAEMNILKGSEQFLKTCAGLHLELFTIPLYKDIALLDEVQAYLETRGFELVKKFPSHGTFNSQNDCVFLNRNADPAVVGLIKQVDKTQ